MDRVAEFKLRAQEHQTVGMGRFRSRTYYFYYPLPGRILARLAHNYRVDMDGACDKCGGRYFFPDQPRHFISLNNCTVDKQGIHDLPDHYVTLHGDDHDLSMYKRRGRSQSEQQCVKMCFKCFFNHLSDFLNDHSDRLGHVMYTVHKTHYSTVMELQNFVRSNDDFNMLNVKVDHVLQRWEVDLYRDKERVFVERLGYTQQSVFNDFNVFHSTLDVFTEVVRLLRKTCINVDLPDNPSSPRL